MRNEAASPEPRDELPHVTTTMLAGIYSVRRHDLRDRPRGPNLSFLRGRTLPRRRCRRGRTPHVRTVSGPVVRRVAIAESAALMYVASESERAAASGKNAHVWPLRV